jgi:hypothetical protein
LIAEVHVLVESTTKLTCGRVDCQAAFWNPTRNKNSNCTQQANIKQLRSRIVLQMMNFLCMSAGFGAKVWKVADPGLPLYLEYERERSLCLLTMSFMQIAQLLRFALRR